MPSSAPDVPAEIDVGERLRELRRFRRCTLRTISARSGLSESFLSQVERGRSSASIESLRRVAEALGVSMADLFEPDGVPGPRVLRRDERPALTFGVLGRKLLLTPQPEGPTSTMVSPSATSKERRPTASLDAFANRLPTSCKEIIEVSGTAALRGTVVGG